MSVQTVMPAVVSAIGALSGKGADDGDGGRPVRMRDVYASIADPRDRRGRRYSLASILLLVQCAVVAGATTWAAIVEWVQAAPQQGQTHLRRVARRAHRTPQTRSRAPLLRRVPLMFDLAPCTRRTPGGQGSERRVMLARR